MCNNSLILSFLVYSRDLRETWILLENHDCFTTLLHNSNLTFHPDYANLTAAIIIDRLLNVILCMLR